MGSLGMEAQAVAHGGGVPGARGMGFLGTWLKPGDPHCRCSPGHAQALFLWKSSEKWVKLVVPLPCFGDGCIACAVGNWGAEGFGDPSCTPGDAAAATCSTWCLRDRGAGARPATVPQGGVWFWGSQLQTGFVGRRVSHGVRSWGAGMGRTGGKGLPLSQGLTTGCNFISWLFAFSSSFFQPSWKSERWEGGKRRGWCQV